MAIEFSSLKIRLSLLAFSGMAALSATVVFSVYTLTLENAELDAKRQISDLLEAMSYSAAVAVYADNAEIAEDVVKGVLLGSFVSSVHLRGHDGMNIKRDKRPGGSTGSVIQRKLYSPFNNNEDIGLLEAFWLPSEIDKQAAANAQKTAISLGALVLLPTALFWLVVSRMVSTPLLALARQLNAIVPGTLQRLEPPGNSRRDELATLTGNINALLNSVSLWMRKERRLRMRVEALEQQYEAIFCQASTGIALIDRDGRCLIANPSVSMLFGDIADTVGGVFSLTENWDHSVFCEPTEFRMLLEHTLHSGQPQSRDLRLVHSLRNRQTWVQVLISCHPLPGGAIAAECLFLDISDRKQLEDEVIFQSHHDPLTLCLNRRGLETRLCLDYQARENDKGTLLLIDLDRFKNINDQWGHLSGDKVLVEVTARIKAMLRSADLLARLGGDEFLIFLHEPIEGTALHHFLERLITAISHDIAVADGKMDSVGASIGVSRYPQDGASLQTLLHKADAALYEVKNTGRNGYCLYGEKALLPVMLARQTPQYTSQTRCR